MEHQKHIIAIDHQLHHRIEIPTNLKKCEKCGLTFQGSECPRCKHTEIVQDTNIPCGKVFETDLVHKDGSKDKLVCICNGEDGICDKCSENLNKTKEVKNE